MVAARAGLGGSSPQRIASYLVAVRPILGHAMRGWDTWIRRIGALMEDVRHGSPSLVVLRAGRIGREQAATFREARSQIERLQPPPSCVACQHALTQWLDSLIEACEILIAVGASGDLRRIREIRDHLAAGRVHARSFNGEYARLADELRARVAAARPSPARAHRGRGSQRQAASALV